VRINAYVLAADPTWLVESVRSYYQHVREIAVSYDRDGRGWTGSPVRTHECLELLRQVDTDGKIRWVPGSFGSGDSSDYLGAETRQRRLALAEASNGADWVLQIDTDEILPNWTALEEVLTEASIRKLPAVEWPMRVLYRRLRNGRYLEIATADRRTHFEYPGPIAVRPGVQLIEARRTDGDFLRPVVFGDRSSLQVQRASERFEHRIELVAPPDAIVHNSWARNSKDIRSKISASGHNQGNRSWLYYYTRWLPSSFTWRALRRFHPLYPPLWPRLQISESLPDIHDD